MAGYADDTAVYVENGDKQHVVLEVVNKVSNYSGLHVNIGKSVALPLGAAEDATQTRPPIEQPIPTDTECRYLGHWTGDLKTAWSRAFESLTSRLILASNSVLDRVKLANALILPKIAFVAPGMLGHRQN
ncbi:hypothetical protein PHYSODRAFT_306249 [Phytophthora sojae]|uniref:Reverse transcriptase domain-containing protein n=1 Tax=Phytophthora sojae (strain P6497) TaxID=1094619 RepID=G5A8L7_PHYSP|nr:hypothetical protein PHYSODRAFT_306226 [Phytophthora sojae]XP_009536415.1 hypothetical protein PHYSODRAFT_306249 [Phytophthora sojae]EGZ08203.1 hypothetical protein PHYSODRAFT_306226 [Phytophthora sojae]EGZ08243.1 hypothetical protein PHYSODRAFT_306249 [Phytophthora sojae]|eukprot:XP_009536375.1 hypothetical protein PHYSODRAFT_306226 [Phytophthora sojae]